MLHALGTVDVVHASVTSPACSGEQSQRPGRIVSLARAAFADTKAQTRIQDLVAKKSFRGLGQLFYLVWWKREFLPEERVSHVCQGKIYLLQIIIADIVNYQN